MHRHLIAGTLALACAGAVASAQSRPGAPGPVPTPGAPTTAAPALPAAQAGGTTLVGCLYNEAQVPGRTPNVAERAGVLEDYILADASAPNAQAGAGAGATAVGTSGRTPSTGNMYKVENIPDERLKALVGKRVEVMGRIDPEGPSASQPNAGAPTPDRGPGADRISLPEFEASSIREIPGTCAASPAPRSN